MKLVNVDKTRSAFPHNISAYPFPQMGSTGMCTILLLVTKKSTRAFQSFPEPSSVVNDWTDPIKFGKSLEFFWKIL